MKKTSEPSIHRVRSLKLAEYSMPYYLSVEDDDDGATFNPYMDIVYGVLAANDEPCYEDDRA